MRAEATRFWYVPDAGGPRLRAVSHLGAPITKEPDSQDHSARPELTPVAGASASTRKQQNQMDLNVNRSDDLVAGAEHRRHREKAVAQSAHEGTLLRKFVVA